MREPDLPTLTTFYAVAPGKTINAAVQILESEVLNNVEIAPFDTWENEPSAIIKKEMHMDKIYLFLSN